MPSIIIFSVYAIIPHARVVPATISIIVSLLSFEKFFVSLPATNPASSNVIPLIPDYSTV